MLQKSKEENDLHIAAMVVLIKNAQWIGTNPVNLISISYFYKVFVDFKNGKTVNKCENRILNIQAYRPIST